MKKLKEKNPFAQGLGRISAQKTKEKFGEKYVEEMTRRSHARKKKPVDKPIA